MFKKIKLVTATEHDKDVFEQTSTLFQSYKRLKKIYNNDIDLDVTYKNTTGLPKLYNKHIVQQNKDLIVVFVHDDVDILSNNLIEALNSSKWDITGLAGGTDFVIKNPAMWHLCCPPDKLSGAVSHPLVLRDSNKLTVHNTFESVSTYGPWPQRCTVVDGLFMAVKIDRALECNFKFDEDFNFHFYDLSSCLIANKCRMTVGTHPIHVMHQGIGDSSNSDEWRASNIKFLNKWTR